MPHRHVRGFVDFVRTQSVIGLAIGLAIGTQVTATTKTIADGFITPLVNFVLSFFMSNPKDLQSQTWHVSGPPHILIIQWGLILSFIIELIAVAAVIYIVFKVLRLDRLDLKKDVTKTNSD